MDALNAILNQLGLDKTFYFQLGLFAALFAVLNPLYFKPFMRLFEARHRRTVQDREAAQKMLEQAEAKLEEYKRRIQEERISARKEMDTVLAAAKKAESEALSRAREEAKKIQHETLEGLEKQRTEIQKKLEQDVEQLARSVSDQLLSRKGVGA